MIISVSGKPGSGKSTVAKRLAEELGYEYFYVGRMLRQAAKEKGMTLAELLKFGENDFSIEKEYDEQIQKLGKSKEDAVVEGRMAFHLIPQSLKIFLDVRDEVGAQRIWHGLQGTQKDSRNEAADLHSEDEVLQSTRNRMASDLFRYKKNYGIEDVFDPGHYDLYLDVSDFDKEQEYQEVIKFVQNKL